jgi:hypothetical protein
MTPVGRFRPRCSAWSTDLAPVLGGCQARVRRVARAMFVLHPHVAAVHRMPAGSIPGDTEARCEGLLLILACTCPSAEGFAGITG